MSWQDQLGWQPSSKSFPRLGAGTSHGFRGHHLEIDSYNSVPVFFRHVEQKLIACDARTGHNDRWRARKAGLWEGGGG